jgi:hypothetical protein
MLYHLNSGSRCQLLLVASVVLIFTAFYPSHVKGFNINTRYCFSTSVISSNYRSNNNNNKVDPLYLFNFFNNNNKGSDKTEKSVSVTNVPKATGKVDATKINQMKGQLEKISNTQNRDYAAEAIKNAPRPKEIQDKQVLAFNFNKANEFPNLYKGWIKSDGDQIAKQMITATKQALKTEKLVEVLFDPVPNLDEVAFGTGINITVLVE